MRTRTRHTMVMGPVVAIGLVVSVLAATPASAEPVVAQETASEAFSNALEVVGATEATANEWVELPDDAAESASLESSTGTLEMSVPASGEADAAESSDVSQVFEGDDVDTTVSLESTQDGLRALIHIESEQAPERYKFEIGGDVSFLERAPDGGVLAYGSARDLIATAAAPWAVDADGTPVPTHFEIDGTDLYQVVEHVGGGFTYGIVADPWWNPFSWPWGKWVKKSRPVLTKALKKCGQGALVASTGLAIGTGTTNVLIEKFGKTSAKMKFLGWQGYVGTAVAGCIINNL